MLKIDDIIKTKLVETGWRFAQSYGGNYLAGSMIMQTVANRYRLGWSPSWLVIIENIPQHMAEGEVPPMKYPGVWEGNFVKLLHAVDGIYDGSSNDLVKGALYWGDLNRIDRQWFKEKIIQARKEDGTPLHPRVADLNSLSFWK